MILGSKTAQYFARVAFCSFHTDEATNSAYLAGDGARVYFLTLMGTNPNPGPKLLHIPMVNTVGQFCHPWTKPAYFPQGNRLAAI